MPSAADAPAKIPIILDTDIGTDIDDAFALALIMSSPEFELLGVTTVSGDTAARARLAAKFLWEAGGKWRQVPVVAGMPGPAQPIEQTRWADGFVSPQILKGKRGRFSARPIPPLSRRNHLDRHRGADQRGRVAQGRSGGGEKNQAHRLDGRIYRARLRAWLEARPEWNIKSNPAAAQAVFASGIPILMAPLDVTAMLKLDAAVRRRIFKQDTPVTNLWPPFITLEPETPTLFDPMAVALALNPSLCQTKNWPSKWTPRDLRVS